MVTAASTSAANATSLQVANLQRVNPHHLWSGLTKDQQKTIGALAVARTLAELRMVPGQQDSWMAAELAIGDALFEAVTEAVGNDQLMTMSLPDLSVIGTPSCQVCGCTDACGCPERCWWIAPGLCSSCAPRVVEAAADTAPELLAFVAPGKGTAPDADPTLLACLNAGLIEFYSGGRGQTAWVATRLGKLLTVAAASAREVEAHD